MRIALSTTLIFVAAALAEIAGCFAFWAWLRQGRSVLWLAPGLLALVLFAYLLTLAPSNHAGRAYAAYGGIYLVASLFWLWLADGHSPDRWDLTGGAIAVLATAIILFAPRSA
jgi:small multidrug resistance family-3 protein